MSKKQSRLNVWAGSVIAVLFSVGHAGAPAASGGASPGQQSQMKTIEPRRTVRTVEWTYDISQDGEKVGSEKVTQHDYNDNSVEFTSEIELLLQQGTKTKLETDLLVEQETYFPISYETSKRILRGDLDAALGMRYEWYSNVAVVYKETPTRKDTLRVILPTGAAVNDVNAAHQLGIPIYWYDTEAGGVQSFNVVDPWTAKTITATLRFQTKDTVVVNGVEVETDRYEFVRAPQTFKIYVDDKNRIVKLDQGYFVYELADWSEVAGREE